MPKSSLYAPDPAALDTVKDPWVVAFRSQRDVGLLIPINYHIVPAVSLKAACFANDQYDDAQFQKCFSNLLAVGLRRFVVDTYWDAPRGVWSLCPAQIPPSDGSSSKQSGGSSSTQSDDASSSSTDSVSAGGPSSSPAAVKRQDASSSGSTTASSVSSTASSTASASSTDSATPISISAASSSSPSPNPNATGTLYQIGPYNCTSTMTLKYLTDIFNAYLDATSFTTDASFTYLIINIHAAASWERPSDPARQPFVDQMPQNVDNLLSSVIRGNLSDELFTPDKLGDQRSDLRFSWNQMGTEMQPRQGYYDTTTGDGGAVVTQNGWPNEAYVQFRDFFRLIAVQGTIDPQMSQYDTAADASTIFPNSTITLNNKATFSSNGTITSGCLFDASLKTITVETNSSWALAPLPDTLSISSNPDLTVPIPQVSNLTACGLSTYLNHSLANSSAATNPLPYAALAHSYIWTWAPGEPLPALDPDTPGETGNRCAAQHLTGPYAGRWYVANCSSALHAACQDPSQPYNWRISSSPMRYSSADSSACPPPYTFSVPHTPLENAHLLSAARAASLQPRDPRILLNLNSVDVAACWVAEVNATCPYRPSADSDRTRVVVVPTVAAIIIFVCAALTFFVKCAANRRDGKRGARRRMRGGWEYEGVPS